MARRARFGGNAITKTALECHYVFLVETGSIWSSYTTTVMIDSNGDQPGGQWFAVVELQGVRIQDLDWVANAGAGFGGNFFLQAERGRRAPPGTRHTGRRNPGLTLFMICSKIRGAPLRAGQPARRAARSFES